MKNCARWVTGGELEEAIMEVASTSATPDVPSNYHTALEECHLPSLDEVAHGDRSGAGSSMEPKSVYFSIRTEEMMQSKCQFSSAVEHEIEHSRVHWSEVSGLSESSEDNNDYEEVNRENEEVFAELMNDPQWSIHEGRHFFQEWPPSLKLGQKIAEGGQGAIYEVIGPDGNVDIDLLLKVFKRGSRLSDLKKQWPCGMFRGQGVSSPIAAGTMLDDGRFAFAMNKCLCDLRKLIDQAMQEKNNQGPPFPYEWRQETWDVRKIMFGIADHMDKIHKKGILHRDLKAANILVHEIGKNIYVIVADFECSIGVLGTGFWRAPEVLLALKNRSAIDFSEKMDIYSYGMTCFEIVTGRLPFEGELDPWSRARWDLVIEGLRPELPSDLDVTLKDLIERCWNPIPNERPSFSEIVELLRISEALDLVQIS